MLLSFSNRKPYRHLVGFLISLCFVFQSNISFANSASSLAGSNSWILKELGSKAVSTAATTADANLVVGIVGGSGFTLPGISLGARGIALTAAGVTAVGFGSLGINALRQQAFSQGCAVNSNSSVCPKNSTYSGSVTYRINFVNCQNVSGSYDYVSAVADLTYVASGGNCPGYSAGYVSSPSNGLGPHNHSQISGSLSIIAGTANLPTQSDVVAAVSTLTGTDYSQNASVSPTVIAYPDSPNVAITGTPGTNVYDDSIDGALIGTIPVSGTLTIPTPGFVGQPTAAQQSAADKAYAEAIALGKTALEARDAAIAAAVAAGASPAVAAKAAVAAKNNSAQKVELKDEDIGIPDVGLSTCPDCVDKLDRSQSFMQYAVLKISNKFPFDVIGNYQQVLVSSASCPMFTSWGRSYELCQIKTFFSVIKFPISLSWLIYLVTHL